MLSVRYVCTHTTSEQRRAADVRGRAFKYTQCQHFSLQKYDHLSPFTHACLVASSRLQSYTHTILFPFATHKHTHNPSFTTQAHYFLNEHTDLQYLPPHLPLFTHTHTCAHTIQDGPPLSASPHTPTSGTLSASPRGHSPLASPHILPLKCSQHTHRQSSTLPHKVTPRCTLTLLSRF